MIIEKVSFLNIRKTSEAHYSFIPETNIIIGENGAGKTTILETLFLLSTSKSFRKKQNKALLKEGKKILKAQGVFIENNTEKKIKIEIENNKKTIAKNNQRIKKTSELLSENPMVCMSPEETDVIESYKSEKMKYFDKIIFKIEKEHIKDIKEYNKLLLYRNTLLEQKKETSIWDKQIATKGISIWKRREEKIKEIIESFKKVQKEIKTEGYTVEYINNKTDNEKIYVKKLKEKKNQEKTRFGPQTDTMIFKKEEQNLQEHGSQGEKKLFKHLLKLAEASLLKAKTKKTPIILLDDFFDKLDNKNIMKIFIYFHCKFQTIITTTETNINTIKNMLGLEEKQIKIIKCQQ